MVVLFGGLTFTFRENSDIEKSKDWAMKELENFESEKIKVMYGLLHIYLGM